jgi:soluble lytic murein transglycosylase-like protein
MNIITILLTVLICLYFTDNAGGPGKYRGIIEAEAEHHGIPTDIAMRLVAVESSFRPCVESKAGAVGLAQVLPSTAVIYDPTATKETLCVPNTNVHIAFTYLADLLEQYDGDWYRALGAYNMGPGNMQRYGYPVTNYARRVYGD